MAFWNSFVHVVCSEGPCLLSLCVYIFIHILYSYVLIMFDFCSLIHAFYVFFVSVNFTHRLKFQERTLCIHVFSCLLFHPVIRSAHTIMQVSQHERQNDHLLCFSVKGLGLCRMWLFKKEIINLVFANSLKCIAMSSSEISRALIYFKPNTSIYIVTLPKPNKLIITT